MRMRLSAAFALASTVFAPLAYAQDLPQTEEELLGGPDAPITLRPQPRTQQAAPKPKPQAVAPKPPPKTVVATKPPATKAAPTPRLANGKPIAPAAKAKPAPRVAIMPPAKPAPKIAAARPRSTPREPPVITDAPPQLTPVAPKAEQPPAVLAEREAPPAPPLAPVEPEETEQAPREHIGPVPDQQFAQLDRMIERAMRRGYIHPRTADALYDDLVDIADLQDDLLDDGALRAADRERIDAGLEDLRERIDRAAQTNLR